MSRKYFATAALLAFVMAIICMFFGGSIYNAKANLHIEHLNEMDRLHYFDVDMIPGLSRLAAIITIPFLLGITYIEIYTLRKSKLIIQRNIAKAILSVAALLLILAALMIAWHRMFDFSQWGYAWVFGALITIAGNVVCIFAKK